ncbi:MAG TPA: DegQ family serine endoprotease [Gammaproteobacteria bacterium]|nr:DegQ family serine endoprotease [Gammaproteobacteria bacterium]
MKKVWSVRDYIKYLTLILLVTGSSALWAAARDLPDFTDLVEKARGTVVNISSTQKITRGRGFGPFDDPHGRRPETPFDDFFRRFFGDEYGDGGPEEFYDKSLGSGFIISEDGYILTNNHVIRGADEVIVKLSDKREFVAEVVGSDKRSDIALLKIDADGLPVARIGDSNKLKVGGWVLAIGSPFGFDYTVTAGIVSAKARSLPNENYVPFIQTDVAINPGNSGGPLLNMEGEVVGINSQIYSRTGGFMGLSFAIPIEVVMDVVEQLKTSGHVVRGWLGILIQDVTRELAESFGMEKPIGALVARVLPDSPAEDAGIKVGDVIVEYDGREVESSSALPPMVGSTKVGEKVKVKIIREGKAKTLKVRISELPEDDEIKLARDNGDGTSEVRIKRIDVVVSELTEEQKQEQDDKTGVYVDAVKSGPASRAGIRRGDIIIKFNGKDVESVKHFKELVEDAPEGKPVPVLILRRGSPIFLALKIAGDNEE